DYKELASVALKIFGICINAASVERMWSSMGFLHTNRRNRLTNDKVLAMCQLHASINFSLKKKKLIQSDAQFYDTNAGPIESNVSTQNVGDNSDLSNIGILDVQDVDMDEDRSNDITTAEQWERELHEWEQMLIEEEVARFEEEEELRDNLDSLDGDLLCNYRHPAIDSRAKWELKDIFNSSLGVPEYLIHNMN
ncbi:932_t:CDS:2, partial [Entrophospora sp. SA101]